MKPADEAVAADVQRAVWHVATAVPGLHPEGMAMESPSRIRIALAGWSPSLHATPIVVDLAIDPADAVASAVAALDDLIAAQRRRADDAMTHGIGLPIARSHRPQVTHLLIDASQMALAVMQKLADRKRRFAEYDEDAEEDQYEDWEVEDVDGSQIVVRLLDSASSGVGLTHANGDDQIYDGGPYLRRAGCGVVERAGGRAVCQPTSSVNAGRKLVLVGDSDGLAAVTISGLDDPVPAALVAGMAGRRIGDVATLHPLLDDRIVRNATFRNRNLILRMEPLDTPLSALVGLTAAQAQKHLADVVAAGAPPPSVHSGEDA